MLKILLFWRGLVVLTQQGGDSSPVSALQRAPLVVVGASAISQSESLPPLGEGGAQRRMRGTQGQRLPSTDISYLAGPHPPPSEAPRSVKKTCRWHVFSVGHIAPAGAFRSATERSEALSAEIGYAARRLQFGSPSATKVGRRRQNTNRNTVGYRQKIKLSSAVFLLQSAVKFKI